MDARTGRCIKRNPVRKNLVLDSGLNGLAKDTSLGLNCNPGKAFEFLKVGSGTTATRFPGGAVQFSQAGTALTSNVGFFTSAMVGGIFKRGASGTSGAEVYITAFISTTAVTVATSQTFTNEAGVVWMVQQTALVTPLHTTNTYQTNTGDNETTFTGSNNEIMNLKRTFIIPQQGSPYTVNEIGWSSVGGSNGSGNICGRIVLPSSDVVGTLNFYVVVVTISFTYSPAVPTAVSDVGTNINTAGNAMMEMWATHRVTSNGTTIGTAQSSGPGLDTDSTVECRAPVASYSQQSTIQATGSLTAPTNVLIQSGASWSNVGGGVIGTARCTLSGTPSTSGQSCTGLMFICGDGFSTQVMFDVKFTTPVTLPSGTWTINVTLQVVYGRTLDNT